MLSSARYAAEFGEFLCIWACSLPVLGRATRLAGCPHVLQKANKSSRGGDCRAVEEPGPQALPHQTPATDLGLPGRSPQNPARPAHAEAAESPHSAHGLMYQLRGVPSPAISAEEEDTLWETLWGLPNGRGVRSQFEKVAVEFSKRVFARIYLASKDARLGP